MHRAGKGRAGEQYAAKALENAGMRLLASNFRSPVGEVDLVARNGDTLIFVEVKTWAKRGIADLEYSIGHEKQRRIIETAKYFLAVHREYNEMSIRFDVIFIEKIPLPSATLQTGPKIRHLASAFVECI
ncbi:MAG: YraN family protein [Treponema sp.]|jgi:putative endonuclease|nr:YraN family protein [Treponema sp.]